MSSPRPGTAAGASRSRILEVLRAAAEPMNVEAIAEAVALSTNTVRFHLDLLREQGLITSRSTRPDGPGRPHLAYRALQPEAVDGAAAYRLLAELLADGLLRTGDNQATVEAGRSWADRLVTTHDPSVGGGTDETAAAVARIIELFADGGFAPELLGDGRTVALHSCPFMELATVRADVVCGVHLGMARGVLQRLQERAGASGRVPHRLEAELVRLKPVLDGSGPCLLKLPAPRVQ